MDINFDNKIDYKIYLAQSVDPHIGEGWSARIKTIGKNEIAVSNVSYLPSVFEMGDTLNNKLNWISSQGSYLTICGSGNPKTGEWDETDDGYLGCRIINDLDTQYCWIQMSLSTGLERSWIIKDYAYTK